MLWEAFVIVTVMLVTDCYGRDALEYFVKHRTVQNFTFTVLASVNSSNRVWVEYQYYFKNNEKLKIKNRIESVLNVGIFENPNTLFDCKFLPTNGSVSKKDNGNVKFQGYSFEIVNLLQELLHFRVVYKKFNHTITNLEHSLTETLLQHKIDLLICHPGVNYEKEPEITQLHATLKSDYVLIYKSSKLHFTKDIFILTFAGTLWLGFLVLLIILAICLHISTKRYSNIYNYELWTWVDITLWANAAACQQGLSHTPNGFASRFIFFLGYLTSYLLYTGFAAGITSLLLQQGENHHVTISDLDAMKFKTVTIMDNMLFVGTFHGINNNSIIVANMDDLFSYLNLDNTIGIAPKIFIEQYFASKFNYDMFSLYSTTVLTTAQYSRGFVTLKNNIHKSMLNQGLLSLQETGLLNNALHQSLLPTPNRIATSNYSSAGIEHVGSAILILVVGTLSAIVFLVVELIVALYKSRCYGHSRIGEYF